MDLSYILKRPVITEKSLLAANNNKYTFIVSKKASKKQIKKAIEKFFNVNVEKVWLTKKAGKLKRVGRRFKVIKTPSQKKAIAQLKSGQKIDLFEVGGKS